MVEANLVAPARLTMASGAITSHAAGMHVVCLVAAEAFLGQFLGLDARRVASVAGELFVLAVQRVLVFGEMVVLYRLPATRAVAGGAIVTEAASVGVFRRVAAMAGLRQLRLQVAVFVASVAGDLPVLAVKAKSRFLEVIKTGVFPAHGAVAVLTGRPARTAVHIVGRVAGVASGWSTLEGGIAMTSCTRDLVVGAQQGKFGLAVVKLYGLEALHLMALGAIGAEFSQMDVVRLMAIYTGVWGIAVLFTHLVAGSTGHRAMRAF